MALDRFLIGNRIRKIREDIFSESREQFARRCDLTERHIGQIERGDFVASIHTFGKIVIATGVEMDYILYGKGENSKLQVRENLYNIINRSNKDELDMYYKCICTIKGYMIKNKR